jgi:hypothetical protein
MIKYLILGIALTASLSSPVVIPASAQQRVPIDPSGDLAEFTAYAHAMCDGSTYSDWGYSSSEECFADIMAQAPSDGGVAPSIISLPGGKTCTYPGAGASHFPSGGC